MAPLVHLVTLASQEPMAPLGQLARQAAMEEMERRAIQDPGDHLDLP